MPSEKNIFRLLLACVTRSHHDFKSRCLCSIKEHKLVYGGGVGGWSWGSRGVGWGGFLHEKVNISVEYLNRSLHIKSLALLL